MRENQIERLKWEYLRRSEPYKEFCEWKRKRAKNSKLPLPDKFRPATGPVQDLNPIVRTYAQNGDVHAKTFENWYDERVKPYEDFHQGTVIDLSDKDGFFFRAVCNIVREKFKEAHDREPLSEEMIDAVAKQMEAEKSYGMRTWICIEQNSFTHAEATSLSKKIANHLKENVTKNRIRYTELKTYLLVFDMKRSGKSDEDIVKMIYDVDDISDVTGKRTGDAKSDKELFDEINKFFKYAERIIQNTEKNIFPGEY